MVAAEPRDHNDPGKACDERWQVLLFRLQGAFVSSREFLVRPSPDRAHDLLSRRAIDSVVETGMYQSDKGESRRGGRVSDRGGAACGMPPQHAVRRQPDTGKMFPAFREADPGSRNLKDFGAAIGIENPFRLAKMTREGLAIVAVTDRSVSG